MKKGFFSIRRILIFLLALITLSLKIINTNTKNRILTNYRDEKLNTVKLTGKVIKVIDGDTIEVNFLNKPIGWNNTEIIRLIGINTPELNIKKDKPMEYFAQEAYEFTDRELYQQYVDIQLDNISSERDKYERIIAYVWIDGHLFNQLLVERGFAFYYNNFSFNSKMMNLFNNAEKYAKINKLGMWENGKYN